MTQFSDDATISNRALGAARSRKRRLPLKIADRYLLGHVIEATFRGLGWFAGLLLAFAVITAVKRLAENSLTFGGMIEVIAYQMPRIFLFTLPMSVLFGTVQTFAELSSKGEVTALWAGGMSLRRMLRAPVAWGVALAVFAFWLQEAVVPRAEQKKKDVLAQQILQASDAIENFALIDRRADQSIERTIQAQKFDPKTKTLVHPTIQLWNERRQVTFQIEAERAEWNVQTGQWKFYKAQTTTFPRQGGESTFATRNVFDSIELDAAPDPKLMSGKNMTLQQNLEKGDFELVSIADLMRWRETLRREHQAMPSPRLRKLIGSATFGIHDKIATPLICLALILVGAPLGLRPQRSSGGFAMGLSLAVLLLYYVVWTLVSQSGKGGLGNPYLLAYLPSVVTTLIGVALVIKKSR